MTCLPAGLPRPQHEATLAVLHQLRALGVNIAMDDFVTGYSGSHVGRASPSD